MFPITAHLDDMKADRRRRHERLLMMATGLMLIVVALCAPMVLLP